MQTKLKRFASTSARLLIAAGAIAIAGLTSSAQTSAQSSSTPSSGRPSADRATSKEFWAGFTLFTAPDLTVKDLTFNNITYDADFQFLDSDLYGIGFGYNINDRLNINCDFNYGSVEYRMQAGPYSLKGTGNMFTSRFNFDYNLLTTPITPFISGGVGYMHFDSGIPEGDPEVYCWWDYYWGYICDGYVDTETASEFTWNLGAGVRWDVNESFFLKAMYDVTWMEVGAAGTEAFPQYELQVGWKW